MEPSTETLNGEEVEMSTREIAHPETNVGWDSGRVRLDFLVPGSKFGNVAVLLSPSEAQELRKMIYNEVGSHLSVVGQAISALDEAISALDKTETR